MEKIHISDFQKLDLRVATIIEAEIVPKSEKLLKLKVDAGTEIGERQIIAGIAKNYKPEDLINKQVTVAVNLEPRKLMGLESQGMLLATHDNENIVILTPERKVTSGSKIS